VPTVIKSGSLNLLERSGPVQACVGIALTFPFTTGNATNGFALAGVCAVFHYHHFSESATPQYNNEKSPTETKSSKHLFKYRLQYSYICERLPLPKAIALAQISVISPVTSLRITKSIGSAAEDMQYVEWHPTRKQEAEQVTTSRFTTYWKIWFGIYYVKFKHFCSHKPNIS
jgi:hypothetical protein